MPYAQPPVPNTPPGNFSLSIYDFHDTAAGVASQTITATNWNDNPVLFAEFPYQGCTLEMVHLNSKRNKDMINKPSEEMCSATFSKECIENVITLANQTAMGLAEKKENDGGEGSMAG